MEKGNRTELVGIKCNDISLASILFVLTDFLKWKYTMTTGCRELPEKKTVELLIDGEVTNDDFHSILKSLGDFIEEHQNVKILEIVENFEGFNPSMLWEGIKFDTKHIKNVSHCAIVSDIGWLSPISKAAGSFTNTKVRTFHLVN